MQGPFGAPIPIVEHAPKSQAVACFVGGTGVAPALAGLRAIVESGAVPASGFLTACDEESSGPASPAAAAAERPKLFLFWSAHVSAMSEFSLIRDWVDAMQSPDAAVAVQVFLFETSEETYEDPETALLKHRRPNMRTLLDTKLKPLVKARGEEQEFRLSVFVCGSEGFTLDAVASAHSFQRENPNVKLSLSDESFSL